MMCEGEDSSLQRVNIRHQTLASMLHKSNTWVLDVDIVDQQFHADQGCCKPLDGE